MMPLSCGEAGVLLEEFDMECLMVEREAECCKLLWGVLMCILFVVVVVELRSWGECGLGTRSSFELRWCGCNKNREWEIEKKINFQELKKKEEERKKEYF